MRFRIRYELGNLTPCFDDKYVAVAHLAVGWSTGQLKVGSFARSERMAKWNELLRINRWVNDAIKPITDLEHWGVTERWNYPDDGYGDCEDYALLKRRMLMQAGWQRQALLITVVRDKQGDGHAVLTVKTDKGEFILDNQMEDVLLWSETEYRFVKRQSQTDPNVWIALGDPRPAIATATSR